MTNSTRPDLIYHYCDASALLQILETRELWYTHIGYLNDAAELTHGLECLRTQLDVQLARVTDRVMLEVRKYLDQRPDWQYYVCCFSAKGDKLSQWRAYADDGRGFAIGFERSRVCTSPNGPFETSIGKVEYESSGIVDALDAFFEKYAESKHSFREADDEGFRSFCLERSAAYIGEKLLDLCTFNKAPGFSEEEEWRAVRSFKLNEKQLAAERDISEIPDEYELVFRDLSEEIRTHRKFRSGRTGITPYVVGGFANDAVREVICGPKNDFALTKDALDLAKASFEYSFKVKRSSATYR